MNFILKHKIAVRVLLFVVIFLFIASFMNWLSQPVLLDWNNYSTINGFYEQPKNSIETVFVGSSRAITGFSPMELYRDYGISSYVLGTAGQPIEASYCWVEEAYRYHPKTLKNVVIECAMLKKKFDQGTFQRAIDTMKYPTKIKSVLGAPLKKKEKIYYLLPLSEYHSRWLSLSESDFKKGDYVPKAETRGYLSFDAIRAKTTNYKNIELPSSVLDTHAASAVFEAESVSSLKKIIDFCNEKGLNLILTTTPNSWNSSYHNALSMLAEENHLTYIDLNYPPYSEKIDCNYSLDMIDSGHSNYYDAKKISSLFGDYLVKNCNATDVRGNPEYAFLDEQLRKYDAEVTDAISLKNAGNLCDYLEIALRKEDTTTFITVKDSASAGLDVETKSKLAQMGFKELSELSYGQPYIAVIDHGKVTELTFGNITDSRQVRKDRVILYEGKLRNGETYKLISGGRSSGNVSSCVINGTERSPNSRGINIVVYDSYSGETQKGAVMDSAIFDTEVSAEREAGYLQDELDRAISEKTPFAQLSPDVQNLYMYNYRCERAKEAEELKIKLTNCDVAPYIKAYLHKPDTALYITVRGDAYRNMDVKTVESLERYGLEKVSDIKFANSYAAVIDEGKVVEEQLGRDTVSISYDNVSIVSSGFAAENYSSVRMDSAECSPNLWGINIVVYNKFLDMVIDTVNFNTTSEFSKGTQK